MKTATENTEISLSHWIPGTRMFSTNDGKHLVIDSDLNEYNNKSMTFIRRKTAVLYCDEHGIVKNMTPDHVYPPGTTAEDVLADLGYGL